MDLVFKALADPSRRLLLDRLRARNGQTLRELCTGLDTTRQAVSKHLAVLEAANLVSSVRRGREKWHYLNPAPITELARLTWHLHVDRTELVIRAPAQPRVTELVVHDAERVVAMPGIDVVEPGRSRLVEVLVGVDHGGR